jgi:hypothetical protein
MRLAVTILIVGLMTAAPAVDDGATRDSEGCCQFEVQGEEGDNGLTATNHPASDETGRSPNHR